MVIKRETSTPLSESFLTSLLTMELFRVGLRDKIQATSNLVESDGFGVHE